MNENNFKSILPTLFRPCSQSKIPIEFVKLLLLTHNWSKKRLRMWRFVIITENSYDLKIATHRFRASCYSFIRLLICLTHKHDQTFRKWSKWCSKCVFWLWIDCGRFLFFDQEIQETGRRGSKFKWSNSNA